MNREQKRLRVLIVSSSEKAEHLLRDLLPSASFSPIGSVSSIGEAKRTILRSPVDVLIINAPLKDEFGTQFAIQAADTHNIGVLMLVRSEFFGPVSEKAGKFGVLVLSKPVNGCWLPRLSDCWPLCAGKWERWKKRLPLSNALSQSSVL